MGGAGHRLLSLQRNLKLQRKDTSCAARFEAWGLEFFAPSEKYYLRATNLEFATIPA
jgi:hypothetical protein